jgi:hypothetical protein
LEFWREKTRKESKNYRRKENPSANFAITFWNKLLQASEADELDFCDISTGMVERRFAFFDRQTLVLLTDCIL